MCHDIVMVQSSSCHLANTSTLRCGWFGAADRPDATFLLFLLDPCADYCLYGIFMGIPVPNRYRYETRIEIVVFHFSPRTAILVFIYLLLCVRARLPLTADTPAPTQPKREIRVIRRYLVPIVLSRYLPIYVCDTWVRCFLVFFL